MAGRPLEMERGMDPNGIKEIAIEFDTDEEEVLRPRTREEFGSYVLHEAATYLRASILSGIRIGRAYAEGEEKVMHGIVLAKGFGDGSSAQRRCLRYCAYSFALWSGDLHSGPASRRRERSSLRTHLPEERRADGITGNHRGGGLSILWAPASSGLRPLSWRSRRSLRGSRAA